MIGPLAQVSDQIELIEGDGNDPAPALELLGRAYMGSRPEQILFEKAIDVFHAEAQSILDWDLVQGEILIKSDKPTEAGISFGILGALTLHPNDLDAKLAVLFEVQAPKAADADGTPFVVLLLAHSLRLPMGLLVFSLEEGSILGSWPLCVDADSSRTVELAVAFDANDDPVSQL